MKSRILLAALALSVLFSCSKSTEEPSPEPTPSPVEPVSRYELQGKAMLDEIFTYYYWWADSTPTGVEWTSDFEDYFYDHIVSEDRWSWMTTGDAFRDSEEGVSTGSYGVAFGQPVDGYGDYLIYVRYIFPGSPMAAQGVTRGWRLDKIGGYAISDLIRSEEGIETLYDELDQDSNSFEFWDGSESHSFEVSKTTISTRSYLDRRIIGPDDYPGLDHSVGYFNYWTFNSNQSEDIAGTISMFRDAGVSDLILDLRYNGGGSTDALATLVSLVVPETLEGEVFSVMKHNRYLSDYDESTRYSVADTSLQLSRLFVITGSGTASASEVLINGLRDGLGAQNLITVGDTTYGKPNGMYAFAYPEGTSSDYYADADYVYLPICFYSTNRSGEYIPDTGFAPDIHLPDDIYHDWGTEELLTKTCLDIITGARTKGAVPAFAPSEKVSDGCVRISSPEDSEHYGLLVAPHRQNGDAEAE